MNNAEIQFLKEPRAGGHLVLLGYDSPIQLVLLRTSFANGVCVLWQGRDLQGIRKWARSDLGVGCGGVDPS